jgi:hypothetical protein
MYYFVTIDNIPMKLLFVVSEKATPFTAVPYPISIYRMCSVLTELEKLQR